MLDAIDSVEELEILLLLRQAPERSWTHLAVAQALLGHPASVLERLVGLSLRGLVAIGDEEPPTFRYAPRSAALDATVAKLAAAYKERRVRIVGLIASKPLRNIRAFSDAFLFKKRED